MSEQQQEGRLAQHQDQADEVEGHRFAAHEEQSDEARVAANDEGDDDDVEGHGGRTA